MIFFKPTVDTESADTVYFEALENGAAYGSCKLVLSCSRADVCEITCNGDRTYLVEGLIKSAFNYACNKNCYMGYCKGGEFTDILDKMSFEKENGVYFNDIPSILTGNCCKKH